MEPGTTTGAEVGQWLSAEVGQRLSAGFGQWLAAPEMNPATLMQYLQDDPPIEPQVTYYFNNIPRHGIQRFPSLVRFVRVPEGFQELYQFKESDSFYLTVTGENMLYYLKKELIIKQENARREELETQRYENQMALQRKVFFASIIAILIGVIQLLK